jgi:ABC-2 type transport system permease protein
MTVVSLVIPGADPATMSGVPGADIATYTGQEPDFLQILAELKTFNWWLIIPGFIVFFLLGYFLYSSMFAAIGSTIDDDMGQAQQLMLPIVIPVIFAFIIMQTSMNNPNSGLAVFGSLFPLFSPIVMPARLAFSPPVWQIVTSIALLIGTTVFFTWLAGRIYRVGILMYGKKVTFREMMKWLTYKG